MHGASEELRLSAIPLQRKEHVDINLDVHVVYALLIALVAIVLIIALHDVIKYRTDVSNYGYTRPEQDDEQPTQSF